MKLMEAKNIRKEFRIGKISSEVLKGIDLSIEEGEFVSIVGPSGSGKTTLLYVLSGLETYTSGSVELFGKELKEYTDSEKGRLRANDIGFVFQFYNLIPNLTVYENIKLADVLGTSTQTNKIESVLEQAGMSEFKNYYPSQLSGGMQQRVAIARCLINNPRIIFADEPIGNLDYKNGISIMELFEMLNKKFNKTILMVTHNEDTIKYGTRTIHMLDGMVINDEKNPI